MEKTLEILKNFKPGTYVADDVKCYDENEIIELGNILNKLIYSPSNLRKRLQELGVTITRADFYSEIPLISEIENYFLSKDKFLFNSIYPDNQEMINALDNMLPYSQEFRPPLQSAIRTEYSWNHGPFGFSDAMSYYCMIRQHKPKNIIELGGGSSTLVAADAIKRNGFGEITVIEPYPQTFLKELDNINLVEKCAQEIDLNFINDQLEDGDFLFIDTTHTVKHNSDVLHIYLRLLPSISKDIYVHVHDIYLPFSLPLKNLRDHQIYWNEQYLLYAYLLRNRSIKVIYGSAYNKEYNSIKLKALLPKDINAGGASFWFKQNSIY